MMTEPKIRAQAKKFVASLQTGKPTRVPMMSFENWGDFMKAVNAEIKNTVYSMQ